MIPLGHVAFGHRAASFLDLERRWWEVLDTFVARLLDGLGSYPPYFLELREVNRAGPPVHGPTPPPLRSLTAEQVDALLADGADLLDVRSFEAFAAGHVPGALSNPCGHSLRPGWAGWCPAPDPSWWSPTTPSTAPT